MRILGNTKISAIFNLSTGTVSAATGEPTEIRAGEIYNDVYTVSAIVIPQEVSGKFIKITHENKTYYYTLASAQTLESGHSYSYTLTLKGKQLIDISSNIDEWDDENEIQGDATEEGFEIIPNTQIWYTTIDGKTFTPSGTWSSKLESNTYENGKGILTFNEDVTTIDKYVTSSNMTTITLPNTVTTIEEKAFYECGYLNNITIPKNVNKIDHTAFDQCNNLTSIIVDEENIKYDSRNNCNAIIETSTNILIRGCANTVIPDNVTVIENAALQYYPLTSFTIPNSVTSIGVFAFLGSAFTSITIPKDVNTIRINPFAYCPLASIIVDEENTKYDSRNNCNAIIETATNTLISGCANTVIPNTVTTIGMLAFGGCNSLTEITIPNSVTNIGYDAFSYCI